MAQDEETPEAVRARLVEAGVRQVRVAFVDYNGIPRARSLPVDRLDGALRRGVNFSSPTVDFNSRDLFPPDAAFTLASADFWARADTSSGRPVVTEPHAVQMLADLVTAGGEPWEGCPRTALRRLEEQAATRGLHFNVGLEPEGYIFTACDGAVAFAGPPEFATLDGLELQPSYLEQLLCGLAEMDIRVEQWSKEYGPGQLEINLPYGGALAAADDLVRFKQLFRSLARRHGLLGTFMPKPYGDQAGSGLHVHLSASDPAEPSTNLFDGHADEELGLSDLGRWALGGLLAHGPALTALGATTVNSYKRFLPGSWAPTHVVYAAVSRAAFIRIPERQTARRLELRAGDPAGNPYLYVAGILAAALHGIEARLDPGPATPGDVGVLSAAEARSRGIAPVPSTLEAALNALEADEVIRAGVGPLIVDEFVKIKRSEWVAFCRHVDDWDRAWYLHRY